MIQNNRFVNKSLRLKNYDYNLPCAYFVTICEPNRKCIFGEVVDEKMVLNEYGKVAETCLLEIPKHFKNTETPEFVVMPNHVHAIITIYDDFFIEKKDVGGKINLADRTVGGRHDLEKGIVGQRYIFDLQKTKRKYAKLSVVVSTYKAAVTRAINRSNSNSGFKWQTSFHDHIIRTERALENIADYIRLNPARWNVDLENENYRSGISRKEREKLSKEFYSELLKP